MQKFKYDMLYEITPPTIVLATRYHKKLGVIENVSPEITSRFTMSSHQEISFDVYKEKDGVECSLWDQIVDFKYIYVPEHDEYYEIQVDVDESNKTIKHCTGKSAGECELSQRYLRNFHCNDETDILMDDYVVTTLYNASNPKGSLLDRVLHDKCPDWAVRHVDESIANIQRTFTADGTTIYDFFVNTVATEIGCLFKFDSVNRKIDVYDLWNTCNKCGNRSDFNLSCPKCGSTDITRGYGKWANVFISTENFASEITVDGDADSVKNCFKVSGGDDIITAAFMNLNPNGSAYIYRFSQDSISDMPEELQERLISYNNLYDSYLPSYQKLVEEYYQAVTEELRLHTTMMPESEIPKDTTAKEQLDILMAEDFTVAVQNIESTSTSSADLSVKGYARAIIDPRYTVDVSSTTLSDLDTTTNTRTWTGIFTVKSLGGVNDEGEEDKAKSETLKTVIVNGDYEEFLEQKIDKTLDRSDYSFTTLFNLPLPKDDDNNYVPSEDTEFIEALHLYSLDRLQSFSNSYESILEVLIKQNIAEDKDEDHKEPYKIDIYNKVYVPYYTRKGFIEAELTIREKQVNEANALIQSLVSRMKSIKDLLNLRAYLGEDMYRVFILYLREDTYTNSNYISTGLDDAEVIQKAKELFDVADQEIQKASELQYTLSGNLVNLLNTEEFAHFKDEFEIGDWIVCRAADKTFRLRLIEVEYTYSNKAEINVTFSNATRINDMVSDVADILSHASSMATTYNYVAHQASQGEEAKDFVDTAKSDGIETKDVQILAGNNKDIVVDDHGILARYYDDATGEYSPKQLRITSNIITFTKDNWKTTSAALGEQTYKRYDPKLDARVEETEYGLSAKFVVAGYIEGSTIVSGSIYSSNYSDYNKQGTYIDLEKGYFSFAGGDFKYNQNGLSYHGEIITRALNLDDRTDISISHNNMDIVSTNVTEDGIVVTSNPIEAYQVGFSNGYGLYVPYHGLFTGEVEANNFYAHEDMYAGGNVIGRTIASQTFVKANENLYVGHTDSEEDNEYVIRLESNAGSIEIFSEPTDEDLKGMRVTNANGESVNVFTVNQDNEITFNGGGGNTDYVELTQAEYNALTPEEQMNGTLYFITDGEGGGGSGGGGDTNVYGAFIDTNRVLYSQNEVSNVDYTAIEDCYVMLNLESKNTGSAWAYVDGELVGRVYGTQGETLGTVGIYLKRGQRVTTTNTGTIGQYIRVYGLTFGTNNIFTPQIYSTEEREVGVWIDNKPLYQKTVEISQYNVTLKNDVWANICTISDADYMVKAVVNTQSPNTAYLMRFQIDNGYLQGASNVQVTLTQYGQLYVTLYYTKSTDTAGSGQYNTLGMPMVHYSTDEQIVGTAEDENGIIKPLYEKMTYISSLPNATETEYSLGITNIRKVYYVKCIAETSTIVLPLFYNAGNDNQSKIQMFVSDKLSGKIKINTFGDNRSGMSGTVIIRYTKTTD